MNATRAVPDASGIQSCRRFDNYSAGCDGHIVTYANGSHSMCDYHHPVTDTTGFTSHAPLQTLASTRSGCFPRYPAFACGATASPRAEKHNPKTSLFKGLTLFLRRILT